MGAFIYLCIIGGCINGYILEGKLTALLTCRMHITFDPASPEITRSLMTQMLIYLHKDICTGMCAAAVFIMVKNNIDVYVSINRGVVK